MGREEGPLPKAGWEHIPPAEQSLELEANLGGSGQHTGRAELGGPPPGSLITIHYMQSLFLKYRQVTKNHHPMNTLVLTTPVKVPGAPGWLSPWCLQVLILGS